jgi:hypothetical protein
VSGSPGRPLTVPRRFCGPPEVANGGYVAGVLAERLGSSAEVTLRAPIPLETQLEVHMDDRGRLELRAGDTVYAEAASTEVHLDVHPPVAFADALEVSNAGFSRFAGYQFPGCFVCGTARAFGDGLRIEPGRVPGRTTVAAPWVPDDSLTREGELVKPRFIWAALDCAGAYALHGAEAHDGPMVLGRIRAKVMHTVAAGEKCVVTGWPIGGDGRKFFAGTALFSEQGWIAALAESTWFPAEGKVEGA